MQSRHQMSPRHFRWQLPCLMMQCHKIFKLPDSDSFPSNLLIHNQKAICYFFIFAISKKKSIFWRKTPLSEYDKNLIVLPFPYQSLTLCMCSSSACYITDKQLFTKQLLPGNSITNEYEQLLTRDHRHQSIIFCTCTTFIII